MNELYYVKFSFFYLIKETLVTNAAKNLPLPQRHTPDLSAHTTKINKADYS